MIVLERHDPRALNYEAIALWLGAGLATAAITFPLWRDWYPFHCGLKAVVGIPCALCGGTRAIHAWTQGQPIQAWLLNPLVTAVAAAATLYLPYAAYCVATNRPRRLRLVGLGPTTPSGVRRGAWLALIAAVLLNWAYLIHAGR
jgi:hypothetical protein